jgi:hypothetical protein
MPEALLPTSSDRERGARDDPRSMRTTPARFSGRHGASREVGGAVLFVFD